MSRMVLYFMLASLIATHSSGTDTYRRLRLHYLECIDSSDCNGYECCVFLGRGQYSIPRCVNRGGPFAKCDSQQNVSGEERNVTYFDKQVVHFTHVFHEMCPCELGLQCDKKANRCVDPIAYDDFNDLGFK